MHGLQGTIKLENNKKNHKHSWFSTSATLVNLKLSGMKYIHLTYLNHPANRTLKLYFFFPFSTQKTLLDAKINYFSISNTELQKKKSRHRGTDITLRDREFKRCERIRIKFVSDLFLLPFIMHF